MEKGKTRRILRYIVVLLACVMFCQSAAPCTPMVLTAQAASVKKGLKKEKGSYYYYVNGKQVKKTWKTIKGQKYYFGKNGKAYAAPDRSSQGYKKNIVVKKIGKYSYGFDSKGCMVKSGYYNNPDKFDSKGNTMTYYFDKKGRYQAKQSKKIQKAGDYRADAKKLRAILGKPRKTKKLNSCFEEEGDDYRLVYSTVSVTIHRYPDGREIVFGIFPV